MAALSYDEDLRKRGIVTKVRKLKTGKKVGGIPFTRGPLAHLLRNRFYVGEVAFKGEILAGEQLAIVDRNLFDAVQAKLDAQLNNHNAARMKSEALFVGRIFDDRGNRMSPSHARKRGIKYRYYLSSALIQGGAERAGSIRRVPAVEIEALVIRSVREHSNSQRRLTTSLVNTYVVRVEIQADQLVIQLAPRKNPKADRKGRRILLVPWQKTPSTRRRECFCRRVLAGPSPGPSAPRPVRRWSHRSREGAVGLMKLSLIHQQMQKHRGARKLQRTEGQYDDLARLPRTPSRQSRDRRSLPTGWASSVFAICRPNAEARCWASSRNKSSSQTVLQQDGFWLWGDWIRVRDKASRIEPAS